MLNGIRIDRLGHSGRGYLATSTRAMLAILEHAHQTCSSPETGEQSVFATLKKVLLAGLSKVAGARPYSRLSYLETLLLRTVLAAALSAAVSHQESNAILDLQRLKRAIPAGRTTLCQREQTARVLIRLLVTSDDTLTTLVRAEAPGAATEAA